MGRDKKLSIATPPLQTLSRHKIFCLDRNGLALEKLYFETRGPMFRSKHPVPAPHSVATQNLYRNTGQKSLSRQKKPLSQPKPPSMPKNPVATRRSLSRHGDPCRDTGQEKPCRDRNFSVETKDKKIDFFGRFFGEKSVFGGVGKDFRVEKSSAKKLVKNREKSDIFSKKSDFSRNLG